MEYILAKISTYIQVSKKPLKFQLEHKIPKSCLKYRREVRNPSFVLDHPHPCYLKRVTNVLKVLCSLSLSLLLFFFTDQSNKCAFFFSYIGLQGQRFTLRKSRLRSTVTKSGLAITTITPSSPERQGQHTSTSPAASSWS